MMIGRPLSFLRCSIFRESMFNFRGFHDNSEGTWGALNSSPLPSYLQGSLYITETMHTIVGEIRQVYKQNELNIKMFI